ncbi:MAG: hypothetical protein Q9159_001452 [Coniocarpon cinnabarinum]
MAYRSELFRHEHQRYAVGDDIKTLTNDSLTSHSSAFKSYNESQFTTTRLPNSSQDVLVTPYNALSDIQYFDTGSSTSFDFDHASQKALNAQSYSLDSRHADLVKSLVKSLNTHAAEHFPSHCAGVYPTDNDSKIAIVLVANKYSPQNFWNGRWRSEYLLDPSSGLTGSIKVEVHYYEDGNVRLLTEKPISASVGGGSASEVIREIAKAEKRYQEDLNRTFGNLSEGVFKSLRRQLPVTRQKIEWEKISGYRLGQDIGGGRSR